VRRDEELFARFSQEAGLFNALVFGGIAMTESGMQQVLTK
jgi:hypothetical protein